MTVGSFAAGIFVGALATVVSMIAFIILSVVYYTIKENNKK